MKPRMTIPQPELNRILVVKLADLGDAILATSAVGALRSAFPHSRIDVLTAGSGAAAFQLCDAVDTVITLDKHAFDNPAGLLSPADSARLLWLIGQLRRRRYDAIVLLHHLTTAFGGQKFRWLSRAIGAPIRAGLDNGRGGFLTHRAIDYGFGVKSVHDYGLDVVALLGADTYSARPSISIPPSARQSVDRLLADYGVVGDYVVIHPGVGGFSPARNWFPDRFAAVGHSIAEDFGLSLVLVGANDSADAAAQIGRELPVADLVGKTSFPELAAVLDRARLVIGADSGVAHLAAALDTPVIDIFGPSNHEAWKPVGAQVISVNTGELPSGTAFVVRSALPCSPCFYSGYSLGRRQGCALRTCLDHVTVEQVAQFATQILVRSGTPKSATL